MKEVSIVGKSPGFEKVYDAEGAIWVVSSVFESMRPDRVDLIFQLHPTSAWESWLPKEWRRVITSYPSPYRQYPIGHMIEKYGPVFGSSISWMLALAIEEGFEKINIFGCDMATQQEYIDQRDTLFYWCGRAEAQGIEICIPEDSRLFFKDRLYGVE